MSSVDIHAMYLTIESVKNEVFPTASKNSQHSQASDYQLAEGAAQQVALSQDAAPASRIEAVRV